MMTLPLKAVRDMSSTLTPLCKLGGVWNCYKRVFEKLVKSSKRKPCTGGSGFWRKLIARSNTSGEIMLTVVVQSTKEKAQEELAYLKDLITEFYENGEGRDTNVTSVYSKALFIYAEKRRCTGSTLALSWGAEFLEQKFLGMSLVLDPKAFFYFNVYAAEMICEALADMLKPSRKMSVIEIGCLSGFIGMYLAKFKCEILCVGTKPPSTEGVLKEKNSNCQYHPGSPEELLQTLKMKHPRACAIITTATQPIVPKLLLELRKLTEIKRIVLVTEAATICNSRALNILWKPRNKDLTKHPFFPQRIIPVDTMPNTKLYTMLILLERITKDSPPKPELTGTYATMRMGNQFPPRRNVPPHRNGPYQDFGSGGALPIGNPLFTDFQPPLNQSVVPPLIENLPINPLNDSNNLYADLLQRQDFINNEILAEETRRRLLEEREAETYRQRLLEEKEREAEEYRQRLILEKEREAEEYRQRLLLEKQKEAAEYERKLQKERAAEEHRQMQLKERLRMLEEEEYRRRLLIEERERELMELNAKPTIQDVLKDTIKDSSLSRLNNEATTRLKHVIAEAFRDIGMINPEKQAMRHPGQDRIMPDAQYSCYDQERQYSLLGHGVSHNLGNRNPQEDRNLAFKDAYSHNRRGNEREAVADRRGVDNTARPTSQRSDRHVLTRNLDNREMAFTNKRSKETAAVHKAKPVSLLSLKFSPSIEPSYSQSSSDQMRRHEVAPNERWRNEDKSMYRGWTEDNMDRAAGRTDPWGADTRHSGRSNNEPYLREVHDMPRDDWRSGYSRNDMLSGDREAFSSKSRRPVGRDTNAVMESGYERGSVGSSRSLRPSIYSHIYGHTKPSEYDAYRKPY